jgi:hypothetical protein
MRRTVILVATVIAAWTLIVAAQQPSVLPMGPARERGASITPAYEGWYRNDDGSLVRTTRSSPAIRIRASQRFSRWAVSGACS